MGGVILDLISVPLCLITTQYIATHCFSKVYSLLSFVEVIKR